MAFLTVLIFGADSPLGNRLAFSLEGYAKERKTAINVVAAEMPVNMERVQRAVWENYIGETHEGRPTFIINAYEEADLASCQLTPSRAFTMNSIAAAHIAFAARSADVPLIQISSQFVLPDMGPHDSTTKPQPINTYGVSKMYAERLVQNIYPAQETGGTTIIRMPILYGTESDSVPKLVMNTAKETIPVPDRERLSISFIGEAAFVIARNIIDSPQLLADPIVHVASPDKPITWYEFFTSVGVDNISHRNVATRNVPLPRTGGLVPTPGWLTARGYDKAWVEFMQEEAQGRYITYWEV